MCCAVAILFAFGPRAAILVWWLIEPIRWGAAFDTFLWPFLGFLVLPWTTLMYVAVLPGGINGFDYVWLAIAVAFDLFAWFGGYGNRGRIQAHGGLVQRGPLAADPDQGVVGGHRLGNAFFGKLAVDAHGGRHAQQARQAERKQQEGQDKDGNG